MGITFSNEFEIRNLTEYTSNMAMEMGFDETAAAEITLAVSEIGQNAIRYAGKGRANVINEGSILKVVVSDDGNGIENLERAMIKGYSSLKASLGVGLSVAKRSVDEFNIQTGPTNGTEVTLLKFLPIPANKIEYGVVSLADENYAINGDDFLIKEFDGDKVLLAAIDGTGEGHSAHAVSIMIKDYLSINYRKSLSQLAVECHNILKNINSERGAAVAMAKIESGKLHYLGIGDTHTYVMGDEMKTLLNHDGTIGLFQLPTLKEKAINLQRESYIILCTDGIKTSLKVDSAEKRSAQQLANSLFRDFHREYGDVTVLVTKYFGGL